LDQLQLSFLLCYPIPAFSHKQPHIPHLLSSLLLKWNPMLLETRKRIGDCNLVNIGFFFQDATQVRNFKLLATLQLDLLKTAAFFNRT
jgi:hypothetical protein